MPNNKPQISFWKTLFYNVNDIDVINKGAFLRVFVALCWTCLLLIADFGSALAYPLENVTADSDLYQRVKELGDYGLLDPQDKAVLDKGLVVTRLELALYTEKAGNRLDNAAQAPALATPTPLPATALSAPVVPPAQAPAMAAPAPAPVVAPPVQVPAAPTQYAPGPAGSSDLSLAPEAPVPVMKEAPGAPAAGVSQAGVSIYSGPYLATSIVPALKKKILALRRELRFESEYLRTRLSLDDQRVAEQQAELGKLIAAQDEVESVFRKSNISGGSPHLSYETDLRVENLLVTGPLAQESATRTKEDVNLNFFSDLGGKGSINLLLSGSMYDSNASSGSASIYVYNPSVNYELDGMLGKWNSTVAVEDYTSDTDLGDFTRGNSTGSLRYEDPFDIKKYSSDKNQKIWDDFITSLTYVPSYSSWSNSNNSQRVFDGLYMIGTSLPLLSKDAKATFLVGRVEKDAAKWEEGLKYTQPFLDGHLQVSLSTEWVNENYGVVPDNPVSLTPSMDQKSYAADFGIDLKPVFLDIEGGFSHFYTGMLTPQGGLTVLGMAPTTLANPPALEAPAGQASLNLYPLTFYYTAISDNYLNTQSKVLLAGFNLTRYGYGAYVPVADSQCGFVGMADDLISDRYGWRANLGWNGRKESYMKDWPDFLDDIVVNLDVAQKTEYSVITDEAGNNVVEAYQLVSVYEPEDLGLWGSSWSGYGGVSPVGKSYIDNVEAARNIGGVNSPTYNYNIFAGGGLTQRIPLMLPVYSSPGVIALNGSGQNVYTLLDHLKTFNYITLTTKFQFNKMMGSDRPFYGSFFLTDHQVSGDTADQAQSAMPDPNRPGQTLAHIPNLFEQTVYDGALMYQVFKNVNLMADYGLEFWKSSYTYPLVDFRTDSLGGGLAYDMPWGGSKLEARYKHLVFQDAYVPANNYQADQAYVYFLMQF
jgi:hypothetical protein